MSAPQFDLKILFYSQVENFEDFGDLGRWEREAKTILTTGNVLLLWHQISHNAVYYHLNFEDSLSPGS